MDVKFYSNKISLKGKSFSDFVKEKLNKTEVVKTASVEEKVEKTAKKEEEAKDSGQPAVEAKIVNKPKKEEAKGGKKEKAECCKDGETSGQLKVEPLHQEGESQCAGDLPKKDKKADVTRTMVKLSKLDDKTRNFLRDYWKNLYPAEYVEAMLAEQ